MSSSSKQRIRTNKTDRGQAKPRHPAPGDSARAVETADPQERTLDQLRLELFRKVESLLELWRNCPKGACQRHQQCDAPDACTAPLPPRTMTDDEAADSLAHFTRALQRRAATFKNGPR
ncbi:MAG: hypothetical protein QOJ96_3571 [Alphaproteobacteria bacterium]|jgi:hypothetical protein|nr:hypothetical protein [Alphaproteobacteria bacterium]